MLKKDQNKKIGSFYIYLHEADLGEIGKRLLLEQYFLKQVGERVNADKMAWHADILAQI